MTDERTDMTPETVKAIRLSMRTSKGRPPSQKKFAEFLGMGNSTIARYELGTSKPTGTSVQLLRMCHIHDAVKLMAIYNRREGKFHDVEAGRDCADCGGYLVDTEPDEFSALKVCRDCGSEFRC